MSAMNGKVAVITGGNSGIGLATAKRFVQEGAYVFITGRRQAELDAAVSLIGKNVTAVQGDVSKLDDLDRLYEVVRKAKGRVDVVLQNAAVVDPVPLAESTAETFDKHFALNARGAYFTVQKALPLLAGQCIDHTVRLSPMADGHSWIRCVFGDEGRFGLLRPDLDCEVGRPRNPGERDQSWTDGHAYAPGWLQRNSGRYTRILQKNDPDGAAWNAG